MSATIVLSHTEKMSAAMIGVMRHLDNTEANRDHLWGGDKNMGWQYHIEGAMGECAVAKHLGMFWSCGVRGDDDVGEYQVRTTDESWKKLILHPEDEDNKRYYLVTGLNGTYSIRGWILCRDGKQKQWWQDPTKKNRWAFFVPQSALRSI